MDRHRELSDPAPDTDAEAEGEDPTGRPDPGSGDEVQAGLWERGDPSPKATLPFRREEASYSVMGTRDGKGQHRFVEAGR